MCSNKASDVIIWVGPFFPVTLYVADGKVQVLTVNWWHMVKLWRALWGRLQRR